jgi:hypothetical protein
MIIMMIDESGNGKAKVIAEAMRSKKNFLSHCVEKEERIVLAVCNLQAEILVRGGRKPLVEGVIPLPEAFLAESAQ